MWIFPNLPQNADKIPNSTGPGPRTKNGCDGPALCFSLSGADISVYAKVTRPSVFAGNFRAGSDRYFFPETGPAVW